MASHIINNIDFALKAQSFHGSLALKDCARLQEQLQHGDESAQLIKYQLKGMPSQYQLPSLHLDIDFTAPLLCQRCLEQMTMKMVLHFDYLISDTELTELDERDDVDWLEIDKHMNIHVLIEDEILIAIPIAPVHENECKPLVLESGKKFNPFEILKGKIR